ncbi:MAG: hypothetical protein Q9160_001845 [Pyrenula sp. 1 TL-2023]
MHEAPPPRKTLLEREFEHILSRQRDRVARRERNALRFRRSSDQLKEVNPSEWDPRKARNEQYNNACSLIKQYSKEAGISHVPFLSREERHSHYSYLELYFLKTRLLREKLDHDSDVIYSHYGRPRWYKALSKEHRRWRLQKRVEERDCIRRTVWDKERYALEWHLNLLLLRDVLPFFLDPDNTAFQESRVKYPKSVDPKTSRQLLLVAIQNHPIRSSIFSDLSAYDIAKLLHVLFPTETRRAAQKFLGEAQVRQWVNPLRDVFGSRQLEAILSSVQKYTKSRTSLILFGPDALELQSRLWDVPGHEARYSCQPDHKLRIFYTYRHDDLDRADRLVFNIEDFFMNGVETPKPDGEPYRGLTLYPFHLDPFFDDYKPAYGRSLRPSSPDPRVYAEHVWSETALFWTPSLKSSRTDPSPSFPEYFGTVTELPAGLELRGGIDHGISAEIVRFVATRRTDLPMVFDGFHSADSLVGIVGGSRFVAHATMCIILMGENGTGD